MGESIHYRNSLTSNDIINPNIVEDFENRYKEIIELARNEYEYEPPSKYYKEGFNLYKRMHKYMKNHLLFLHDINVPFDNNLAERHARVYKRKQKQVMTLRSFNNLHYLCNSMSMIALLRSKNKNLFTSVSDMFE
jgi:hypothetical protein